MKKIFLLIVLVAFGMLISTETADAQWGGGCYAPTVTYYAPAPTVAYYAPPVAAAPVTAYYAPTVATVPVPITAYSPVAVPVTTFYAPAPAVPVTAFYARPAWGYDPTRILPRRRWAALYPAY